MHYFDLSTLSKLTGMKLRKLRYCVAHELVPEGHRARILENAAGRPWKFDPVTSMLIIGSGILIDAGMKRDSVRWMMKHAPNYVRPGGRQIRASLINGVTEGKPGILYAADGTHMRWNVGQHDSGWIKVDDLLRDPEFNPVGTISLNLATIWAQIRPE